MVKHQNKKMNLVVYTRTSSSTQATILPSQPGTISSFRNTCQKKINQQLVVVSVRVNDHFLPFNLSCLPKHVFILCMRRALPSMQEAECRTQNYFLLLSQSVFSVKEAEPIVPPHRKTSNRRDVIYSKP